MAAVLPHRVPHPTALMKITTRCGEQAVTALNEELLAAAVEARVVKTGKARADTTVVSADVDNPTDSGLLARTVRRMSGLVCRIRSVGVASRTPFGTAPARGRAAGQGGRGASAAAWRAGPRGSTGHRRTDHRRTGRAGLPQRGRGAGGAAQRPPRRAAGDRAGQRAAASRRQRTGGHHRAHRPGGRPGADPVGRRYARLGDPPGQPARSRRPPDRERPARPVEFGYKAQVVDNEDGIVLDHTVEAATHRTARNWRPRSSGSPTAPDDRRVRWPRTAATARPASNRICTTPA